MGKRVLQNVNRKLKFLYRKKDYFGANERKLVCASFLQSHFDYACNYWYRSLSCSIKNKLQCAQNKIIRYVLNYHPRKHVGFQEFRKLGWLNVSSRVDYLTLNLMYCIFNGSAPAYFSNFYYVNHRYSTRRSQAAFVKSHVGTMTKYSFKASGIKLWNDLPANVKTASSKSSFKKLCKSFLMDQMNTREISEFI